MRTCDKTRFLRIDVVTNGCSYAGEGGAARRGKTPRRPRNDAVTRRWAVIDGDIRRRDVVVDLPAECKIASCQILRTRTDGITGACHGAVGEAVFGADRFKRFRGADQDAPSVRQ